MLAEQSPHRAFTSLAYLMDIDWLKEAYRRTLLAAAGDWTMMAASGEAGRRWLVAAGG